jgi:hypothetical protein
MNRTGQQRIQHRPRTFQAPEPDRPLQIMSLQAVQAEATSGRFFNLNLGRFPKHQAVADIDAELVSTATTGCMGVESVP